MKLCMIGIHFYSHMIDIAKPKQREINHKVAYIGKSNLRAYCSSCGKIKENEMVDGLPEIIIW